jgi:hypothetical protein
MDPEQSSVLQNARENFLSSRFESLGAGSSANTSEPAGKRVA